MTISTSRIFLAIAILAMLAITVGCGNPAAIASIAEKTTSKKAAVEPAPVTINSKNLTRESAAELIKKQPAFLKVTLKRFGGGLNYHEDIFDLLQAAGMVNCQVVIQNPGGMAPRDIVNVTYTEKLQQMVDAQVLSYGATIEGNSTAPWQFGNLTATSVVNGGGAQIKLVIIPLATIQLSEVTGIVQTSPTTAKVEWTWKWAPTQAYNELNALAPNFPVAVISDKIKPGVFQENSFLALYDDGWRIQNPFDMQ
jgi:hypothetical protein